MGFRDYFENLKDDVGYKAEIIKSEIDDKVCDVKDFLEEHEVADKLKSAGKAAWGISKKLIYAYCNAANEKRMETDPAYAAKMEEVAKKRELQALKEENEYLREQCNNEELPQEVKEKLERRIKDNQYEIERCYKEWREANMAYNEEACRRREESDGTDK